ncbi:MAG TPA: phosphotransferase [Cryomorphaceae bacterium]|nr:phosphotransferase [Cryomorphaceae bacterium]
MKFELKETNIQGLESYLQEVGVITSEEKIINLSKAGEGNMNLTLRAETERKSLIVKQANPFVQKYPSIPAPVERSSMECTFFKKAGAIRSIAFCLPTLLYHDAKNHVQVMQDLGKKGDYSRFYDGEQALPANAVKELVHFLRNLHESTANGEELENRKMRELNHTHIFDLPFNPDNGLNLDEMQEGLQALAHKLVLNNADLRKRATELGELYLSAKGPSLLHGDFFPGSWLDTEEGVKIIDPEFCFTGPVEFELGVFKAHLIFCGMSERGINTILRRYGDYDKSLSDQFAGIEILRRLYGVAQLPMTRTVLEKEKLSLKALKLLNL